MQKRVQGGSIEEVGETELNGEGFVHLNWARNKKPGGVAQCLWLLAA